MCGHVGIAGKLLAKDEPTMKRLLMLDYFRGPDSTGLAAITGGGLVKIAKLASHPCDLFEHTGFKTALNGNTSTVFLGHNRSATKGKVSTYNAHPFQFGHIVGAHNGTLSIETHRRLEDKLGEKYEVDSMAIYACIEKFGIEETVALFRKSEDKTVCPDAWALVWYNLEEKTLNFLRNKERPMWYSFTKEFDRVFWASEWPMIQAATAMSGAGYELYEHTSEADPTKIYRFFCMDENVHYKFNVDELKKGSTIRPKPKAKTIEGKEVAKVWTGNYQSGASSHDPFQRGTGAHSAHTHNSTGSSNSRTSIPNVSTGSAEEATASAKNFLHVFAGPDDPYGGIVSEERFRDIAQHGCSWCEKGITFNTIGCTIIDTDDLILCPDCSSAAPETNRVYLKEVHAA